MELNKFIEDFALQFDETDLSEFKPETRFRELEEWSSVVGLLVIVMADEKYNVRLNRDHIINSKTIFDLYNVVESEHNKMAV